MVHATSTRICNPPVLPDYLKNVYNLKPIVGAPNDDEVKVPGMFSPDLSMSLAQYLFEVQMARYRERYPCALFPEDVVHTPPELPSHVSIDLEPVHGVPSNDQLQNVQAAMRAYEQVANIPSMFDPNVSMELSQHLFNIQFARYMNRAPEEKLVSKSQSQHEDTTKDKVSPTSRPQQPFDPAGNISDKGSSEAPNEVGAGGQLEVHPSSVRPESEQVDQQPRGVEKKSDQLLERLVETMDVIKLTLIRTQQGEARTARRVHWCNGEGNLIDAHEALNGKGEHPKVSDGPLLTIARLITSNFGCKQDHGLPRIAHHGGYSHSYTSSLSEAQLVQYLRFYDIGHDLIQGDTLTIKDGQREVAQSLLSDYIN